MSITCIVQALPGSGKSTLGAELEEMGYRVVDSDTLWTESSGKENDFEEVVAKIRDLDVDVLLTNLWLEKVGFEVDLCVFPEWNTWVETLISSRNDLVTTFGFAELKNWYADYENLPVESVVKLEKGAYLSSQLAKIEEIVHGNLPSKGDSSVTVSRALFGTA